MGRRTRIGEVGSSSGRSGAEELLTLPAQLEGGHLLRKALERALRPIGADSAVVDDVLLSASEAFSNAIRYGTSSPEDQLRVRLHVSSAHCTIILEYPGDPFPTTAPALPEPDSTGGRGRWLMEQLCDSVDYQFDAGITRLQLLKRWA